MLHNVLTLKVLGPRGEIAYLGQVIFLAAATQVAAFCIAPLHVSFPGGVVGSLGFNWLRQRSTTDPQHHGFR